MLNILKQLPKLMLGLMVFLYFSTSWAQQCTEYGEKCKEAFKNIKQGKGISDHPCFTAFSFKPAQRACFNKTSRSGTDEEACQAGIERLKFDQRCE